MKFKAIVLAVAALLFGQGVESTKMISGTGLYWCEDASTIGKGNIIGSAFGRGFKWDEGSFRIFPCIGGEYGILPWLDVSLSSEILTYGWSIPGDIRLKVKAGLPLENRLRLFNGGISATYINNLNTSFPSNGWRIEGDLGFSPEGLRYVGSFMDLMFIGDADIIAWKSFLPLKAYLNVGWRVPFSTKLDGYYQTLIRTGICYKGLITDFFIEYSLEAFQGFKGYREINFSKGSTSNYRFPYYFSENPMYITPGFRMKYSTGASITISIPVLISQEQGYPSGSTTTDVKNQTGLTDGFSPFYADWKLTARLDFPFRYTPVNAEIVRKFILLKSRKTKQTIDIDEQLKKDDTAPKSEEEKLQQDLDKKREEMLKENLLE